MQRLKVAIVAAATAVFCALILLSTAYARADERPQSFDIGPQSLASALTEFARQSKQEILFAPEVVAHKLSSGVRGTMSPDAALKILLKDSGLTLTSTPNGAILVGAPGSGSPQSLNQGNSKEGKNSSSDRFLLAQAPQGQAAGAAALSGQSSNTQPPPVLQEVIVTAQKREERLIDTPQSVSVLSSDYLSNLGATQFRDFANTVPGLSFSTAGAGNTQVTLRGVTVGFDISPTVGVYIDEVPYGSSTVFNLAAQFSLDKALFDLDRIEVLRGPQGTLYGASAMGGLIKYVTQRPDTTRFGGDMQAGVSSTEDGGVNYVVAGAVNMPIAADTAAVRVSGYENRDGGFIDNVALGQKNVNRSDTYGGRVDFLLTPMEALSIRLTGFAQDISRDGEGTADYTFAGAQPYGSLGQYRKFEEPFHEQFRLVSGTVVYDFGPLSLTSISAYQTSQLETFWDISAVYVPYGLCPCSAIGLPDSAGTDKFTQEVRLASKAGSTPLEWVLGGWYNHEASSTTEEFVLRDLAGNPLPNNLYNYYVPSTFEEYALFGDLTWHISSRFDVTGGLRDAHNSQEFTQYGSGLLISSAPTSTSSEGVVTYLANARYHVSQHATAYLRYATGYRPGGPNIVTAAGGPSSFASDSLRSYEAGFKAESADGRFTMDLDGYAIDWSNIQIGVIRNGFQTYTNAPGGATIQGSELTLTARPVDAFKLSAAFAYQHAYMNQAVAELGAAQGERLPNVPHFTGTVSADYTFSNEGVQPTLGTTVRYVGERDASFDQSVTYPQYHLPQYTLVDLRAGVMLGKFNTQLYVHNVFDDRSQFSIIFPQFGARVAIAQPRTVGVNVSTKF